MSIKNVWSNAWDQELIWEQGCWSRWTHINLKFEQQTNWLKMSWCPKISLKILTIIIKRQEENVKLNTRHKTAKLFFSIKSVKVKVLIVQFTSAATFPWGLRVNRRRWSSTFEWHQPETCTRCLFSPRLTKLGLQLRADDRISVAEVNITKSRFYRFNCAANRRENLSVLQGKTKRGGKNTSRKFVSKPVASVPPATHRSVRSLSPAVGPAVGRADAPLLMTCERREASWLPHSLIGSQKKSKYTCHVTYGEFPGR